MKMSARGKFGQPAIPLRALLPTILLSLNCLAQPATDSVEALLQAERAFAQSSVDRGMRAAFLEYFAPDGINFTPHPVNTREALLARPAPPDRSPITLNWAPRFAEISSAGDLGYTTGPYLLTDSREGGKVVGQGHYFSVWKLQAANRWQVVVDYGIETPPMEDNVLADPAIVARGAKPAATVPRSLQNRSSVIARDRAFSEAVSRQGMVKAYREFTTMNQQTRLLRNGRYPLVGKRDIERFLPTQSPIRWDPFSAGIAHSGDLAFTYGKWSQVSHGSGSTVGGEGYYLRVWKPDDRKWKVVAEVLKPVQQ